MLSSTTNSHCSTVNVTVYVSLYQHITISSCCTLDVFQCLLANVSSNVLTEPLNEKLIYQHAKCQF